MNKHVEVWDDDEDLWGDILYTPTHISDIQDVHDNEKNKSFENEMIIKDINEIVEKTELSGIPLPKNIVPSSLIGGTIRRLGTRKAGVAVMDDWSDDLQLTPAILNGKVVQRSENIDDDDDIFKEIEDWSIKTIKPQTAVQKRLREGLLPRKSVEPSFVAPNDSCEDAFEKDFDIPLDVNHLYIHHPPTKTYSASSVSHATMESDNDDWGDSSLGIRSARGDSRSARASVTSSLSPSMSSITLSEDEGILDGIELSSNTLDLQKRFDTCRQKKMNEPTFKEFQSLKEDFFSDIELDEDHFLDPSKNLNSNVNIISHLLTNDTYNLQKKPQATIKFSAKTSRIPQPIFQSSKINKDISKTPYHGTKPYYGQGKEISKKPSLINFQESDESFHVMSTKRSMPSLQTQHLSPQCTSSDNSRIKSNYCNTYYNQSKTSIENGHSKTYSSASSTSNSRFSKGSDDFSGIINRIPRYASPTNASLARGTVLLNKFQKCTSDGISRDHSPTRIITQPQKFVNFGDGTELDAFDDLPICPAIESKYFQKNHKKEHIKYKDSSNVPLSSNYLKMIEIDRYREKESFKNSTHPMITRQSNLKSKNPMQSFSKIKLKKKIKQMPTLIRNLNSSPIPKVIGQMKYNPQTRIWEGNEIELQKFDLNSASSPRPALISHISDKKDIQVVGDMMFDPLKMCWVKIDPSTEDEKDPFEGIVDLVSNDPFVFSESGKSYKNSLSNSNYLDTQDFVVGEEFDVGPGFVQKQKKEEEYWRKNMQGWIKRGFPNRNHLREIRKIVINEQ